MKKSILAILSIILLTSCSKDDDNVIPENTEGKYRMEISHEGNKDAFTEFLTLTLLSPNSEATIITNEEFESNVQLDKIYTFYPPDVSIPTDREIETSPNVVDMNVNFLMSPIEENSGATLSTRVAIYKNDVWIKTVTHNFKGIEPENFNVDGKGK